MFILPKDRPVDFSALLFSGDFGQLSEQAHISALDPYKDSPVCSVGPVVDWAVVKPPF